MGKRKALRPNNRHDSLHSTFGCSFSDVSGAPRAQKVVTAVQARRALPPGPLLRILSSISSSTSSAPPLPLPVPVPWEGWPASPELRAGIKLPASQLLPLALPHLPAPSPTQGTIDRSRTLDETLLIIRESQADELLSFQCLESPRMCHSHCFPQSPQTWEFSHSRTDKWA